MGKITETIIDKAAEGVAFGLNAVRASVQSEIDKERLNTIEYCIEEAAKALLEAGVDKEKTQQLLCKHWDFLSFRDVEDIIERAETNLT